MEVAGKRYLFGVVPEASKVVRHGPRGILHVRCPPEAVAFTTRLVASCWVRAPFVPTHLPRHCLFMAQSSHPDALRRFLWAVANHGQLRIGRSISKVEVRFSTRATKAKATEVVVAVIRW
mmetsp:Transcript_6284/g.17124  ORF Transcript_6284/g.17124 Transcript_6284/m.17124 type:complete len:120 (+) Transcript_6284:1256-1615(+)